MQTTPLRSSAAAVCAVHVLPKSPVVAMIPAFPTATQTLVLAQLTACMSCAPPAPIRVVQVAPSVVLATAGCVPVFWPTATQCVESTHETPKRFLPAATVC